MTTLANPPRRPKDQPGQQHPSAKPAKGGGFSINVGKSERVVSTVTGGLLAAYGLRRRTPGNLLLAGLGGAMLYRGLSGHCPAYKGLGVSTAEHEEPTSTEQYSQHGVQVDVSVSIQKPKSDLYRFWRDFRNLPRFMTYLKSVQVVNDKRSHWVIEGPAGTSLAWDAEIINDEPDALIAWQSLQGGDVDTAGSVRFLDAPAGRGTEVKVVLDYVPPAGKFGAVVAWFFGRDGESEVREDLRHFKQMMEAGEIPTIEGQPQGTCRK